MRSSGGNGGDGLAREALVLFANRIVPCLLLSVEFSVDHWTSEVEAAVCPGHNTILPTPGLKANRSSLPSADLLLLTASLSVCHRV